MNNCQEIHFLVCSIFSESIYMENIQKQNSWKFEFFCFCFFGLDISKFSEICCSGTPEKPRFCGTTRYPPLVAISLSPPFLIILTFGGLGAVIRWLRGGKSIEDEGLTGESRPPPSMETGLEAAEEEEEEEGAWITVKATRWLAAIKKKTFVILTNHIFYLFLTRLLY